jgi:BCD family chlorophyll transporter-like MFS transporter
LRLTFIPPGASPDEDDKLPAERLYAMSDTHRTHLSLFDTLRLGLVNVAVGMSALLVFGVLNRVMISEWKLNATLVGVFVFVHYAVCPIRTLAGYASDTRPLWGWKRTPYVFGGMAVSLVGVLLIFHTAQTLRTNLFLGVLGSVFAYGLWGVGINTASVSYLALMSDLSGPRKSRTISVAWFMMIAFGIVATGIVISKFFALNLSRIGTDVSTLDLTALDAVLTQLFYTVVGVAFLLVVVGLVGLEPRLGRRPNTSDEMGETPRFRETLGIIAASRESKLFFAVVFMGIFGVNAQDILMEPYGAQVLRMSLEETTRLQPVWGGATLISMLVAGLLAARLMSRKSLTLCGAALCTVGLSLMIAAGRGDVQLLRIGVAVLGGGNGLFAVGALSLMMDMTRPGQAGIFLGVWGIAQALAQGAAGLTAGAGRDAIERMTGDIRLAYQGMFALEALALAAAIILLLKMRTPNQDVKDEERASARFADIVSAN